MSQGLVEEGRQSTALPIEIGFLASHGFAPAALRDAATLAEIAGVPADVHLLKSGLVEEHAFYRALAAELGLPFVSSPRLSGRARYPEAILVGVAPLAEPQGGFVIAPSGVSLTRIMEDRRRHRHFSSITTPSLLTKAVFEIEARGIADRSAYELPCRRRELSSFDGVSHRQIAGLSAVSLLLSFGGYASPGLTLALVAAGLSPLFLGMVVLRLAASVLDNQIESPPDTPRAEDATLPVYTIIVALYRERRVVSRLIAALMRLDYPVSKLDIKLVLEADDQETMDALGAIDLPGFIEVLVAPTGQPRTKPRALNVALPLAWGQFTVVYDAEDVPEPDQLRLALATFARRPDVACLQARLTIDNTDDSWLTRLFTIEYAALFDVFNPGLAEIGCPIPLGGTSNHFRTSALKDVYGWDAWNVTEDADLGIRLARLGYRVADLPSSTLEEAPITLRAWMSQRTRWMKGYMQTSISHSRNPLVTFSQLGFWRFYGAVVLTTGAVLSALFYPIFTSVFLISWLSGAFSTLTTRWGALWYSGSLVLFLLGAGAVVIPACVALRRRGLWRLLPWILLLPLYYALVSLAAWRGLWELAIAPFRWNKTSHGHARTSRSGLLQKHQARAARTMSLNTTPP